MRDSLLLIRRQVASIATSRNLLASFIIAVCCYYSLFPPILREKPGLNVTMNGKIFEKTRKENPLSAEPPRGKSESGEVLKIVDKEVVDEYSPVIPQSEMNTSTILEAQFCALRTAIEKPTIDAEALLLPLKEKLDELQRRFNVLNGLSQVLQDQELLREAERSAAAIRNTELEDTIDELKMDLESLKGTTTEGMNRIVDIDFLSGDIVDGVSALSTQVSDIHRSSEILGRMVRANNQQQTERLELIRTESEELLKESLLEQRRYYDQRIEELMHTFSQKEQGPVVDQGAIDILVSEAVEREVERLRKEREIDRALLVSTEEALADALAAVSASAEALAEMEKDMEKEREREREQEREREKQEKEKVLILQQPEIESTDLRNETQSATTVPPPPFDFAARSAGSRIVHENTSATYFPPSLRMDEMVKDAIAKRTESFGISRDAVNAMVPEFTGEALLKFVGVDYGVGSPEDAISQDLSLGSCWPMKGSKGVLTVEFQEPVYITAISLDHIGRLHAPDISTAPRSFEVYGRSTGASPKERMLIAGKFIPAEETTVQTFHVAASDEDHPSVAADEVANTKQNKGEKEAFQRVSLRVLSNHGHPNYTCIYRFRVHGSTKFTHPATTAD